MRWMAALMVLVASLAWAGDVVVSEKIGTLAAANAKLYLTKRLGAKIYLYKTAGTGQVDWKCVPYPGATGFKHSGTGTVAVAITGTVTTESCTTDCAFSLPVDCYSWQFEATSCTGCSYTLWAYARESRN